MILLSVGRKGSGKSTALRALAARCLAQPGPRPLIWFHDPKEGVSAPAGSVFTSIEAWRLAKRVPPLSVFRAIPDLNELARLACEVKDVTLIIDELDRACDGKRWYPSKHLANADCRTGSWVERIVNETRHYRVNLWGGVRRFANLPEDVITAADVTLLFNHDAQAIYDLQAIARRHGPAVAEQLPGLQVGEFVIRGQL